MLSLERGHMQHPSIVECPDRKCVLDDVEGRIS